ncbi:MAG: hypothetical protein ABFE07_21210 [Armatimonadia bacterium]
MNRTVFFDRVRARPFGGSLSQPQVSGLTAILDAASTYGIKDERYLAYALATAYHETAHTMQPIAEYGKGKGRKYGVKGKHGQVPYGRGYVQLTWDTNYERADKELGLNGALLKDFDLAMRPGIAAGILFEGMTEGWFTGKKLSDYFTASKADPVNARRIINGTDKASMIAGYYNDFLAALVASDWGKPTATVTPLPPGRDYYTPADVHPPSAQPSWLAALVSSLIALFKRSAK